MHGVKLDKCSQSTASIHYRKPNCGAAGVTHRVKTNPSEGWEEAFAQMAERGDDQMLDPGTLTEWDKSEWEW